MRGKRTNHPLGRRTMAALLAICMLLTMTPAVAAEVETRTLTGFTALSDEVREQTVPHGTAREDLTLPDTLEATALVPAPAEPEAETPTEQTPAQETEPPVEQTPDPAPAEIIEDAEPPLADAPAAETVLVTGVTWESAPAYDGAISGTYVFAPVLPATYVPAAGVSLPEITVTVAQDEPSAADYVVALIDALPTMDQWQAMDETAARAVMDEILVAKAAYDALTAEEQAQMDEASTGKLLELAELAERLAGATPMADTANPATVQANTTDTTKLDVIAGGTTTTVDPLAQDVTITGTYTSLEIDVSGYTGEVVPNVVLSNATILPLTPEAQSGALFGTGKLGTAGTTAVTINGVVNLIVNADSTITGGQGGAGGKGGKGVPGQRGTASSPDGKNGGQGGAGGAGGTGGAGISITGTSYITTSDLVTGGTGGVGGAGGMGGQGGLAYNDDYTNYKKGESGPAGSPGATGAEGQAVVGTQVVPPTISAVSAADITGASATLSATIAKGGETVTEAGFFYKAASDSTWTSTAGTGTDSVTLSATGLTKDAEYTVRAYAVVNGNKLVGEPATLTPMDSFPTLDFATPDSTTPATGDGYVWVEITKTLTLTDFNYTATDPVGIQLPDGATLVLNGTSSVAAGDAANISQESYGVHCLGTFTVRGTGSLVATAGIGAMSVGVMGNKGLIINSGTLTGIGKMSDGSWGVAVMLGDITVKGGNLVGIGATDSSSSGVGAPEGTITVNGGSLTAKGGADEYSMGVMTKTLTLGPDVVAKCNIGSSTGYKDIANIATYAGLSLNTVYEGTTQTTIATDVKISKPDIASGTCNTCSWRIDADGTLTIYPTNGISGTLSEFGSTANVPWYTHRDSVKKVAVASGVKTGEYAGFIFSGLSKCTEMDLSGLDTSAAMNMRYMFDQCSTLVNLDVKHFNTANVKDMSDMFSLCQALKTLDLSGFNTANVTTMSGMFSDCRALETLNLSGFNTANVENMSSMFSTCTALETLDLSSFDTAKVKTMKSMFSTCLKLTALDFPSFSNFKTDQVTDMSYMFHYCSNLTALDLSSFNTAKVKTMSSMFNYCSNLASVDVSSFNTAIVENMSFMFAFCSKLPTLDLSSFTLKDVVGVNATSMLASCNLGLKSNIYKIDMTNAGGSPAKIYAFGKNLPSEFTATDAANSAFVGPLFCEPFAVLKGAGTTNGSFTVSTPLDTDIKDYFTKTKPLSPDENYGSAELMHAYPFDCGASVVNKVTLTLKPDNGYQMATFAITAADDTPIETKPLGNNAYEFEMPRQDVTVNVTFKAADIASGELGGCTWGIDAAGVLTIAPKAGGTGVLNNIFSADSTPWYAHRASVKKVVVASGVKTGTNAGYLFSGLSNCTEMDLSGLDTSAATSVIYMFADCTSLEALDLTRLNLSSISTAFNNFSAFTCMLKNCTLALNTNICYTGMDWAKIYLYNKQSSSDLTSHNLYSNPRGVYYMPFNVSTAEAVNGTIRVGTSQECLNYFEKTKVFNQDGQSLYDPAKAYGQTGQTVTLYVKPDEGYAIQSVRTSDFTPVEKGTLQEDGSTSYTFTMGGGDVTASATFRVPGNSVTIAVSKDGELWTDHGKTFQLSTDDGATFITDLSKVPNGTYTVYEGSGNRPAKTSLVVTVNGANVNATLNYYTVTVTAGFGTYEANGGGVYCEQSVIQIYANVRDRFTWEKWSDGVTERIRQITVTGKTDLTATATRDTPIPTAEGTNIFANGTEINIAAGTTPGFANVLYDVNGDGDIGDTEYLQIGSNPATDEGYDLSGYAIYGGKNNEALTGDTNITMTGGKVSWIYGGGFGASGTVDGSRYVTVGGTAVIGGAENQGVVIGRGTSWDDNTYVGVKDVTVQSGFTGKVYVVLPTDFDLNESSFTVATGVTQAMLDNQHIVLTGPGSTVVGVEQRLNEYGNLYMEPPMLHDSITAYDPYIFANGYPITIKAVGTEGNANVYFDHYRPTLPVKLFHLDGNTAEGYDMTKCDIYGGSLDKDITMNTQITLEGGSVFAIYGGSSSYNQTTTLTGDTNITIKGGMAESVYGGGDSGRDKTNTITGTCHVTVEGGEVGTLYGGSNAVGAVDVRLTGGMTGTVRATSGSTTVNGSSTISITGEAVVYDVYAVGGNKSTFGGTATLTVGGNVQIGAEMENEGVLYGAGISLDPNGYDKGVASFAISAPLTGKVYGLLPSDYDASTRPVIATNATAEDLKHFALTSSTVSDLGVKAAYLEGTEIKVKGGVTVTLDYQGADGNNTTATMPVYHGEAYGTLPAPTKSGFGFTGWYDAATGGNLVTKDTLLASGTIDHTLHARWGLTDPTVTLAADKTTADYTGSTAITLTATAGHSAQDATFAYEWYKGGVKLDGKTASTLTLQNVADSGSYTVKARAASGGLTSAWVESSAVTATINKATPTVTTAPTAGAITYGQALSDSILSGGTASTPGSFAWTDTAAKPACADSGVTEYGVTFTPTDTANYNTATCAVKLTVNKATLTVSVTANNKTYDGTRAATGTISLTGGVNGEVPTATGSFSFADGDAGNSKPVSVVITLDGNWGDNYALNANTTNVTANIIPRSLGNGTAVPADGITVDAIAPQPYQGGTEVKPLPVVKADGKVIDGGNYTLSYTANTAPGTATVTITGTTNYTGSVTATFTIVLGTAPENSFTKPDGLDEWGKTPIVVTGNAGYTVSTAFDSGFGSDVTLSTEGTKTITIYVKETATGAVTQAEISYKLDTTAPNLGTVTGNPSNWVTSAEIGFTPSDATSGVASVTVTCDDGKSVTHDNDSFTADRNGTYTITVTDQAGNTATETVTVSKVDGTKPTVSIAPTPDSGKWYGATEFVVTSGDGDGGSGVASVTVSGGKFTNADILAAGKFTAEESTSNSYTYTVTVTDGAGNANTATVTIQLDPKIDEFVAKVGTVNSGSTYEDLRTVQKWLEDQSKIVQSHITNSTVGKAALDKLNGWLDGKTTEAAQAVVDAINGADTIAKIEQAQKDYNALTDAGKAKVTNKDKLDTLVTDAAAAKNVVEQLKNADKTGASYEEKKSALESYDKLTDAQKALADKDATTQKANVAADLSALQAALDKLALVVKPYTPATKALIADAKSAYDALDADCKAAFPKDKKAALDALETMRAHAQSVEDKIAALGDSPADADVQAAQAAYNALTADEKLLVDGAKKTELDAAYQAMLGKLDADSKSAAEFATKVAEVKSAPTVERIKELERDYGKLTPGAKGKVDADSPTKTDYDKLVADKAAAQPVIDKLNAIDLSKLTPENKSAVDAALGDYNGLTPGQKVLVDEATGGKAGILAGANAEIADVTTKIDNILSHDSGTIEGGCPSVPDAGSPTGTDHSYNQHKKSIEDAKLAYERLSDPARKLVPQALKDKLNREYDALISYLDYVNTAATVKSKVEVAGLAENVKLPDESAGAGKTVVTVVMEDTKPAVMPPKPAEKSEALSVDVKLVASIYHDAGDATPATTETVQPKDGQPVLVKLLLPTGYALDTLEIWHVKESGSRSRIYDFWLVTEGGGTYAVFEVSSFSHFVFFAEKIKEPDVPTPPTPDHPGTGTGGGSASFQPGISKSEHGSVTASPERAKPGDKVTISAKPDAGYAVDTVIVKDSGGKTVAVTPGKDGTYTFTQPSGKVTVTVTFKPTEQKPTELPFTDVAQNDWFRDSVAYVYGQGLMNGTSSTTFSPYLSTDRGMIVTILWRMEGSPTATKAANFTDVAPGRYYSEAVAWGAEQGIILGYDDRRYAPGDPITREQLASILWRYARYKKWDVSVGENTNILSYLDFPQISEYAIPALQWAAGAQIMSGKGGGILDPKGNATRAETATMLERFLKDKH